MNQDWYAQARCKPCGLGQWLTSMDRCAGCGSGICQTCLPFVKQKSCVICLKFFASCCGTGHDGCRRNYREWEGTSVLRRGLEELRLGQYEAACRNARLLTFNLNLGNGVAVWPLKWEEANVFPDKQIPGDVMASSLLAACSSGVGYKNSQGKAHQKIHRRFAVLQVGNVVIADETHDVPIGALVHFVLSPEEITKTNTITLTIVETAPTLQPHCVPKINHIDPFPVLPLRDVETQEEQAPPDVGAEEAIEFDENAEDAPMASDEEEAYDACEARDEWIKCKRRRVEEAWKARGYLLHCAVTTGGYFKP